MHGDDLVGSVAQEPRGPQVVGEVGAAVLQRVGHAAVEHEESVNEQVGQVVRGHGTSLLHHIRD